MAFRDADWRDGGFTPETEQRFYTFTTDAYVRAFVELANAKEALPPYPEQYGRHSVGVAGHPGIGLWPMRSVPHWTVPKRFKADVDFFYGAGAGGWVVSDRARLLFEEIDGPAFEFDEALVTHGADGPMELGPYWRIDVYRVLDCIDDERSVIDGGPSGLDSSLLQYVRLIDVRFKIELVDTAHAFRVRQGYGPIFDSAIVDEIRSRKYRGMSFTPLQMPTFAETKGADIGRNSQYWRSKSPLQDYWEARHAESDRRYREKLARKAK